MLTSVTTVVERRTVLRESGTTVPFEAAWASEAMFFVQAEPGHPVLAVQPEVSPDGLVWAPWGTGGTLAPSDPVLPVAVANFGTWLRLRIEGPSPESPATVLVHLTLKG